MKLLRLFALLFVPALSFAQFTTVTGTVTDPNGLAYANGTISPGLVLPGGTSPTLNGLPYTPPSQPTGLDGAGKFTMRLADNTVLLPGSTQWTFLVCSAAGTIQPAGGKGPVCFNVPALTISGSSQSITSNISAVPPPALSTNPGTGTVTSIGATAPITATPSPIIGAGTIACATCATTTNGGALSGTPPVTVSAAGAIGCATCALGPGASTANHVAEFSGTDGLTLKDGGAAGSGTVTNTAGNLTSGNVAIGNGTNDLKVDSALSTNGAGAQTDAQGTITTSQPLMSHTVTWNAAGVAFTNWLSNITCTAAATGSIAQGFGVAGTTWQFKFNGANCTNPQLLAPAGSSANVTYSVNAETNTGMYSAVAHDISFAASGTRTLAIQSNAIYMQGNIFNLATLHAWINTSAPTITGAGCGGSGASIASQNGSSAFEVNVGTSNTGTCTISMPATVANAWLCQATDTTTNSTSVFITKQSGLSNTQVVLKNYSDVAVNGAWTDSDVLGVTCTAQ